MQQRLTEKMACLPLVLVMKTRTVWRNNCPQCPFLPRCGFWKQLKTVLAALWKYGRPLWFPNVNWSSVFTTGWKPNVFGAQPPNGDTGQLYVLQFGGTFLGTKAFSNMANCFFLFTLYRIYLLCENVGLYLNKWFSIKMVVVNLKGLCTYCQLL